MGWVKYESFWLSCPDFADVFVGRKALKSFEASSVIVRVDKITEMRFELLVIIVMITLNCRLLDGSVHALDLPIRPRMFYFCQAMLNVILLTAHVEHVRHISGCWPISVARG